MKKTYFFIVGLLLFCANSYSQTAEEDAIKKVCIAQTQAYADFDYEALASYHVQSAEDLLAWNTPNGAFGTQTGWENIRKSLKYYFQTGKKQYLKSSSENYHFIIHGDMAFVWFDYSTQTEAGKTTLMKGYRSMLKINGQWKILAVLAYVDHTPGK